MRSELNSRPMCMEKESVWRKSFLECVEKENSVYHALYLPTNANNIKGSPRTLRKCTPNTDDDELATPDMVQQLTDQLDAARAREAEAAERLGAINALWTQRILPIQEELAAVRDEAQQLEVDLAFAQQPSDEPTPTGPSQLKWVDGNIFFCICTLVIVFNLVVMYLQLLRGTTPEFKIINNVVLIWYILELILKAVYFQQCLLIGKLTSVWWNWLDLIIVLSSILDQWIVPLLSTNGSLPLKISVLRALRLLRLIRVLKLLKSLLFVDFSWAAGARFESFIAGVIAVNAVFMGMELDIPWEGWAYIEQVLLAIFAFEFLVKLKLFGAHGFFSHKELYLWNILDFIIVSGGALDLWAMPTIKAIMSLVRDGATIDINHQTMKLLRLMRIMRVFRLVRLAKSIKPLFKLMTGVAEGLSALFWFAVLVFITLYALSIVFVIMVNDGYLFGNEVPEDAKKMWGTVPHSMYALFKLMNDDQSVVSTIDQSALGIFMFVAVMVISNWALLAILTSVVSDNMLSASSRCDEEQKEEDAQKSVLQSRAQLKFIFEEVDSDRLGIIDEGEWNALFEDPQKGGELEIAAGFGESTIRELFDAIADHNASKKVGRLRGTPHRVIDYNMFINEAVRFDRDHWASLALMTRIRSLDRRMAERFDYLVAAQEHALTAMKEEHEMESQTSLRPATTYTKSLSRLEARPSHRFATLPTDFGGMTLP